MHMPGTPLLSLIARAAQEVQDYQTKLQREPTKARVSLSGEPYVFLSARSLALTFPQMINETFGLRIGDKVIYQLGYIIAFAEAEHFFQARNISLKELDYRVLTGTLYSAGTGFGNVELLDQKLCRDHTFHALWETPNSFSAEAAIASGLPGRYCHIQAGYAAGWCSAATGLELACQEIACAAEGVKKCRFLIAHLQHLTSKVSDPSFHKPRSSYYVIDTTNQVEVIQ
jgi:hypothetical protein